MLQKAHAHIHAPTRVPAQRTAAPPTLLAHPLTPPTPTPSPLSSSGSGSGSSVERKTKSQRTSEQMMPISHLRQSVKRSIKSRDLLRAMQGDWARPHASLPHIPSAVCCPHTLMKAGCLSTPHSSERSRGWYRGTQSFWRNRIRPCAGAVPTRSNTGAQPPHITCPQNLSNKDSQPHACN